MRFLRATRAVLFGRRIQQTFFSVNAKDALNEFQLFAEQELLKPFSKPKKGGKPRAIHAPVFPEEPQPEKEELLPNKKFMPAFQNEFSSNVSTYIVDIRRLNVYIR